MSRETIETPENFQYDKAALAIILPDFEVVVSARLTAITNKSDRETDEARYGNYTIERKIFEVLNNFFFHLPNGWYRTMEEEAVTPRHKEIWNTLDNVIEEAAIEIRGTTAAEYENRPEEINKLARLYAAMRQKGFTQRELAE